MRKKKKKTTLTRSKLKAWFAILYGEPLSLLQAQQAPQE